MRGSTRTKYLKMFVSHLRIWYLKVQISADNMVVIRFACKDSACFWHMIGSHCPNYLWSCNLLSSMECQSIELNKGKKL